VVFGTVFAFDIEPEMVEATQAKARDAGATNVQVALRDVMAEGTGLPADSIDYFMLFNLLHAENPMVFLHEAFRVLREGGRLGIIHWNYDSATPRGPSLEIRPRPAQCQAWAESAGFHPLIPTLIDLPSHHYGLVYEK
jgi:ubiquinone/menaquinone biosynthesis C-methylase UbiE